MSTQPGGPPNKFDKKVNVTKMSSDDQFELLNREADLGHDTFLFTFCSDGNFIFFGRYSDKKHD